MYMVSLTHMQCSAEAAFMCHCRTNFENDAPKLSPRDIWRILILGLAQNFESVSYMENSHAKNNLGFHRNSHSCNGYFDGVLDC